MLDETGNDTRERMSIGISGRFKIKLKNYIKDNDKVAGDYFEELHENKELRETVELKAENQKLKETIKVKDEIIDLQKTIIDNKDSKIKELEEKLQGFKYYLSLKTEPRTDVSKENLTKLLSE